MKLFLTALTLVIVAQIYPAIRVISGSDPLFQSTDMTYEGAFKIANGTCGDHCNPHYGATALAFDASSDSGNGGVFYTAFDAGNPLRVGELKLKTSGGTDIYTLISAAHTTLAAMPTVALIQDPADPLAGAIGDMNIGGDIGTKELRGLLVADYSGTSRLIVSGYGIFDTSSNLNYRSHFVVSKTLSSAAVIVGPTAVTGNGATGGDFCTDSVTCGSMFMAGGMLNVPSAYQAGLGGNFLTGQCCGSIIAKTSYGPTLTAATVADLGGGATPAPGTNLLRRDANHFSWGNYTTVGDGGGTRQWSQQNDLMRMVWPTGFRTVLVATVRGENAYNCYGRAVAGDTDGDPVELEIGALTSSGSDASTAAVSGGVQRITLPNSTGAFDSDPFHDFIALTSQTTPVKVWGNRNYQGMAKIVAAGDSGLSTSWVEVAAADAFTAGLTSQAYRRGIPSCYDPATHDPSLPDTTPNDGHGPTARGVDNYKFIIRAFDTNTLADAKAGTVAATAVDSYAEWEVTNPVDYPAGKYAHRSLGGMTIDTVHNKILLVSKSLDSVGSIIVMVFGFTPGVPTPAPLPRPLMGAVAALGALLTLGLVRRRRA